MAFTSPALWNAINGTTSQPQRQYGTDGDDTSRHFSDELQSIEIQGNFIPMLPTKHYCYMSAQWDPSRTFCLASTLECVVAHCSTKVCAALT